MGNFADSKPETVRFSFKLAAIPSNTIFAVDFFTVLSQARLCWQLNQGDMHALLSSCSLQSVPVVQGEDAKTEVSANWLKDRISVDHF